MATLLQAVGLLLVAVGVGARFGVDIGVIVAGVEAVVVGVAAERGKS